MEFSKEDVQFLANYLFNVDLTPSQTEIAYEVAFSNNKRVIINSYTRHGKTFSTAVGILLYILFNENKKIRLIAPIHEQATILRNYIAELIIKNKIFIDLLDIKVPIELSIKKEVSKSRITFKNNCELVILSAQGEADRLLGWGGDLIVIDESCLIDYEVYKTKISRMLGDSPNSKLVEISNPWHKQNQFYEHWISTDFKKIHIPYTLGLSENRISQEFINEQKKLLSPLEFKILYEAEFPEQSEDALFNYEVIKKSINLFNLNEGKYYIGVDVARFGNDLTVATIIQINNNQLEVKEIKSWEKTDTMISSQKIIELIQQYNPEYIIVDDTGVGGAITDRLTQLGYPVYPINFGNSAINPHFLNMKTEIFFNLSNLFTEQRLSIIENNELISQLVKMRYELTTNGKIKINDNQNKSPDYADSLALACWATYLNINIDNLEIASM
ncbi:MAG: terminase family protein [Candidatus Aenigmatarchaeota archaeon]